VFTLKKILIPVDGSAGSDKAVRFALSLTEEIEKEIIILNVQPNYSTPNVKRFISQEQINALQKELSDQVFAHTLEITNSLNIPVRTQLRIGDPGKEIIAEAEKSAVDFIVMGYRGLGFAKRTILGSVATHVLHETKVPVMIVP
jgi:nucleotide-binding universal stress UspA family protein